jgi:hypothetical protein
MKRNDWVFVGMRLVGLWYLVRGLIALPIALVGATAFVLARGGWLESGASFTVSMDALLGSLAGVALFFGAPAIERWLAVKDARIAGRSPAEATSAGRP